MELKMNKEEFNSLAGIINAIGDNEITDCFNSIFGSDHIPECDPQIIKDASGENIGMNLVIKPENTVKLFKTIGSHGDDLSSIVSIINKPEAKSSIKYLGGLVSHGPQLLSSFSNIGKDIKNLFRK